MIHRDWLPSLWNERKDGDENPLVTLRKQMDSMFEDFNRNFAGQSGALAIRSNVSETDKDVRITADLPGVEKKDVDITVTGNQISIKAERKSEREEKGGEEGRQFHRIERSAGMFQRNMALPFEIDANSVSAEFRNGVLTVTIAKPQEVVEKTRKIEVKQAG